MGEYSPLLWVCPLPNCGCVLSPCGCVLSSCGSGLSPVVGVYSPLLWKYNTLLLWAYTLVPLTNVTMNLRSSAHAETLIQCRNTACALGNYSRQALHACISGNTSRIVGLSTFSSPFYYFFCCPPPNRPDITVMVYWV